MPPFKFKMLKVTMFAFFIATCLIFLKIIIGVYLNFFNKSGQNTMLKSNDQIYESFLNFKDFENCKFSVYFPKHFIDDNEIIFKTESNSEECKKSLINLVSESFVTGRMKKKFLRFARTEDSFIIFTIQVKFEKDNESKIIFKNLNNSK